MQERHEQPATLERNTTSEEGVMSQRRPHSWVAIAGRRLSKQVGLREPGMARRGRARRHLRTEAIT
jgi:hypothetical protein